PLRFRDTMSFSMCGSLLTCPRAGVIRPRLSCHPTYHTAPYPPFADQYNGCPGLMEARKNEATVTGVPRAGTRAWGWFRLLHPFPSILVTAATAIFAELAEGGQAPVDRLLRLVVSVACSQFAIGA